MNKQDIVEVVAKKTDLPKTHVTEVLNETIELIGKTAKKEIVILLGLGTFKLAIIADDSFGSSLYSYAYMATDKKTKAQMYNGGDTGGGVHSADELRDGERFVKFVK